MAQLKAEQDRIERAIGWLVQFEQTPDAFRPRIRSPEEAAFDAGYDFGYRTMQEGDPLS